MHVCRECGLTSATAGACHVDGTLMTIREDDPLVGSTIGPYRVAQVIGVGGMGRVYKGVHPQIGSRVAIKVLAAELAHRGDVIERFFAEARSVNLIRHESLVNVLDLATLPDGRPYIVMEFLDGAPLSTVMRSTGPMPLGELARLMAEVLDALALAHERGIVHRDLKPDNLWVTPSGRAKVLDFGIAKLAPEQGGGMTHAGSLLGTPSYMSPEQALAREVDHRADLYALGVILYEAATGRRPFESESVYDLLRQQVEVTPTPVRALRPDLPEGYAQVIAIAMAKDPGQRFASATAMANALRQVSADLPAAQWLSVAPQRAETTSPSGAGGRGISPPPGRTPGPAPQLVTPAPTATRAAPPAKRRSAAPWIALGLAVAGGAVAAAIVLTRGGDREGPRLPPNIQVGPGVTAGGRVLAPTQPGAAASPDVEASDRPIGDPHAAQLAALAALAADGSDGSGSGSAGAATVNDAMREFNAAMANMSPEDRDMLGSIMKDPGAALGELSKMFEGLGVGLGALAGSAAAAGGSGAGSAGSGTAQAPAWTSLRMLAPPRDPRRVDPSAQVRAARDALLGQVPDVAPTYLSVMGVGPGGLIDLTGSSTKVGMISMMLTSPRDHGCMTFSLSRTSAMLAGVPPVSCTAPLPWPRCTVAEIRKRADAAGAGDQPLMITYSATGGPAQWMTMGTGGAMFMQAFPDDCEAAS